MLVKILHKDPLYARHMMGMIPYWLSEIVKKSAREQLNDHYMHGGGWRPFEGHVMNHEDHSIKYPGDPALMPLAEIHFRDERIYIYDHAWVAIVQPNNTYEICRMD